MLEPRGRCLNYTLSPREYFVSFSTDSSGDILALLMDDHQASEKLKVLLNDFLISCISLMLALSIFHEYQCNIIFYIQYNRRFLQI